MGENGLVYPVIYLAAAVIAVPLFRWLKLGAILGYLFAGAMIGPEVLNFIEHPHDALHLAELGVVMLLFVIGLELEPEKLWRMKASIGLLGGGQLIFSALVITLFVAMVFGLSWPIATVIGLTLGLSSTAFAVQLMDEQGIMGTELGRKGFAILLLQDLAVIPILLLVGMLAPQGAEAAGKAAWWLGPLVVVIVLIVGRFALNPLLSLVARYASREVLTAAALLIVLGTATVMYKVGLSMGMGAFLAGILLANSSFKHQLEADIEPFKGLLLGLFFIAVGMTLDLQLLFDKPLIILGLALLLMAAKALVIFLMLLRSRQSKSDGLKLGLMLSQGGEFAFVVMTAATTAFLIDSVIADHIVLIVGVSMALTAPLVILAKKLERPTIETRAFDVAAFDTTTEEEPQVIIAGFGRFGQITGRILTANKIPFAAMDKDSSHVDFVKRFGNKIYYGDATRQELLEAAGVRHARVLVLAVDRIEDSMKIVTLVKSMKLDITIIARARNRNHMYRLLNEGVDLISRETFESGLQAAGRTLTALGFTGTQAKQKIDAFREHDERHVRSAAEHENNTPELIKMADQGRKELEKIFASDQN